jgi:glycosyltransferase involved in cell wall biosynthesis
VGDRLRVLLCEPYFTGSHRSWAEGYATASRHEVVLVTHAGGFWKWRMQGAALTLAGEVDALVGGGWRPDVLLVSGMVHVPALVGLARDALDGVPIVLYLHENQLTYPMPDEAPVDHTYAMTNWLSMAAADTVVFNSEHHRRDLLGALPGFLRRFPDHRHTGWVDEVTARTEVLPVGIDVDRFAGGRTAADPPTVVWNHRWEYDKGPAAFFAALGELVERGLDFRVALAGEAYHAVPPDFEAARRRLADRVAHFGTATDAAYPGLLRSCDVVVSTARHEFFGVAVLEAVAAGAFPVLPNRLSYPELLPAAVHDVCLYDGPVELVDRLGHALTDPNLRDATSTVLQSDVRRFDWRVVAPRYDALLARVAARDV